MSTSPVPPLGTPIGPKFESLSPETFAEKILGLIFFVIEGVVLGWKTTLLAFAAFIPYLTSQPAINTSLFRDPKFYVACGAFIGLLLKTDGSDRKL